jgi:[glutamine synthetase] adenylyltransferase / [glutamine synthetase]-adenylyl-L-tyrosine phosphorylase
LNEPKSAVPDGSFDPGLFREPERARKDLERLRRRVPQGAIAALATLLSESPDPDQALNLLERLASQAGDELITLFEKNRVLLHHAIVIFGHSYWLGETLLHHPDMFYSLHREKNLERSLGRDDYREGLARLRSRTVETDTALLLARFKRREYVRIALRDVLGIATLAVTAEEISALADVIIEEALREAESQMRKRHGRPEYHDANGRVAEAAFAVLALGKLGGNELNYSSDVDLLYLYDAQESFGPLSMREYFIRQAQLLTEILSCATVEGPAFRIDLRLRPQGHEGEPAIGLAHALNYYAHVAHDWELQALIKARHSAGDAVLAREFIRGVQRQVYTEDVNFAAIETALHSRQKMGAQRRRLIAVSKQPARIDVKLDRGGIRDVEFLVQCLQRVFGGAEPWLRSGGTLFSLQKLHDKGHLSGKDFHELTVAYEFLRKIEHRLQLQRGQQVHRLPGDAAHLEILHRAVGRGTRDERAGTFLFALQSRMARVAEIYERVIHSQRRDRQAVGKQDRGESPVIAAATPALRPMSFDQVAQRAAADSPALGDLVVHSHLSLHARRALYRLLSSAMTSTERYAALLENPQLVAQAVELLETSEYLTDILVRHPDAMRALEHMHRDSSPATSDAEGCPELVSREPARDPGEAMAALRRGFRSQIFAVGAQDVLAPRPALDSMRQTTRLADAAVRSGLRIVHGEEILAVFALGRLGTQEFDIASDADLLFVRDPETSEDEARAAAEKLMHTLAAYTREGTLFAVDARLRPHGAAGELVVTPAQLERYLADEAQPWEALTYTKLRFVAGREDVSALTLPLVRHRIVEMGYHQDFPKEVLEMRMRLEKSNRYPHSFKLARGGFYDIDFITSFLMLRHALLWGGNTLDRLEHLRQNGALQRPVFATLKRATLLYRTADHVIRMVTGRARPELPEAEHARHATEALVNKILARDPSNDLQAELRATAEEIREIFMAVVRG